MPQDLKAPLVLQVLQVTLVPQVLPDCVEQQVLVLQEQLEQQEQQVLKAQQALQDLLAQVPQE